MSYIYADIESDDPEEENEVLVATIQANDNLNLTFPRFSGHGVW